jgi:hypothetical protein
MGKFRSSVESKGTRWFHCDRFSFFVITQILIVGIENGLETKQKRIYFQGSRGVEEGGGRPTVTC